jgi:hypothetical protein
MTAALARRTKTASDARKTEERLSPAWIATTAMTQLDATDLQKSKPLVYLAAHLHLRQTARQTCRKQFDAYEDEALDPEQQELFQAYNHDIRPHIPTRKSRAMC